MPTTPSCGQITKYLIKQGGEVNPGTAMKTTQEVKTTPESSEDIEDNKDNDGNDSSYPKKLSLSEYAASNGNVNSVKTTFMGLPVRHQKLNMKN